MQLLNYENNLQDESDRVDAAHVVWHDSLLCLRSTGRRSKVRHFNRYQNQNQNRVTDSGVRNRKAAFPSTLLSLSEEPLIFSPPVFYLATAEQYFCLHPSASLLSTHRNPFPPSDPPSNHRRTCPADKTSSSVGPTAAFKKSHCLQITRARNNCKMLSPPLKL